MARAKKIQAKVSLVTSKEQFESDVMGQSYEKLTGNAYVMCFVFGGERCACAGSPSNMFTAIFLPLHVCVRLVQCVSVFSRFFTGMRIAIFCCACSY